MSTATIEHPQADEYAPYAQAYVSRITESDVLGVMEKQIGEVRAFYEGLPPGKGDFAYAPGKWTLKEILGHLADAERVLAYRALRFARNDSTPLAGFDEDAWVPPAHFGDRTVADLLDEWITVRRATLSLFKGLPDEAIARRGTANNKPLSVRAVPYFVAGHVRHHFAVIRERYLDKT